MEKCRNQLLDEFKIEIAGGFGPVKGKIWRVGLMGYCKPEGRFVLLFLAALKSACSIKLPRAQRRGSRSCAS